MTRRSLSLAPTVMTFLAVAGDPTEPLSTMPSLLASVPSLPAENVMVMSRWFQMKSSALALSVVYAPACELPHELEWMRAPAVYACWKSVRTSLGMPVR